MAVNAVMQRGTSIALACRTFQISETCYRYSPILSDENEKIADCLERLTENKRTCGFGSCFYICATCRGKPIERQWSERHWRRWNHKRVHRIYCKLELNLQISRSLKPKTNPKRAPVLRGALIVLFGLRRGCDSATCHHLNQMRAVLWAAMQVSDQVIRADSQTCDCDSREISSQRGLGFCPAVHTLV